MTEKTEEMLRRLHLRHRIHETLRKRGYSHIVIAGGKHGHAPFHIDAHHHDGERLALFGKYHDIYRHITDPEYLPHQRPLTDKR